MLALPDQRVSLLDQPPPAAATVALEAVFVGAAAGAADPGAAAAALDFARRLGFDWDAANATMNGLPLAFDDFAGFAAAFPGDDTWLARALRAYFLAGGERAIVVRVAVDPGAPLDAYLSRTPLGADVAPAKGVDIAMAAPQAGLLLLPDLEQACFAAARKNLAAPTPAPPPPVFRPLDQWPAVAAPASSVAAPDGAAPVSPFAVVNAVNAALAAARPDMQLIFALPIGADQTLSTAALIQRAKAYLYGEDLKGADLPQVQALAPLLRDAAGDFASPSGGVAGVLAAMAETDGVWRALYGRALPPDAGPARQIESNALAELRIWGVTVLRSDGVNTRLDGDVLAFGANSTAPAARRLAPSRRLMGWLLRNLRDLGEQLVFENVLDDGRVELVLMDFFDELQKRGALNGKQVADAVTLVRGKPAPNAVQYDIAVDAAVTLETIRLRFLDGGVTATAGGGA